MRHFFYVLLGGFVLLVIISMATEKPRQYRVANGPEKKEAKANAERLDFAEAATPPRAAPAAPVTAGGPLAAAAHPGQATHKASPSTVIAYSRNDVGGRIVLTAATCEKNTGLSAYTTHPDGAIDFGCWAADELYVLIHWDKAGLQNYGHERFHSIKTHERLAGTMLLELAREPLSRFANKPPSSLARKP